MKKGILQEFQEILELTDKLVEEAKLDYSKLDIQLPETN
jgi:hypothetical protein